MGAREHKVESYLQRRVREAGGLSLKWASTGMPGVPDQIVFLEGRVHLVEVKTVDGRLSPGQKRTHEKLAAQGFPVTTVYGRDDVDRLMESWT